MTTEAGNKIIAEFMGGKLKRYNISNEPYYLMPNKQQWMPERLVYHSSWDWLMPVAIKCYEVYQKSDHIDTSLKLFHYDNVVIGSPINVVWEAVIETIQWFYKRKIIKQSQQTQPT